jgi:hypothetical protein
MVRAMWPAFRRPNEGRHLLGLFLIASLAIALFYGAGLMYGRRTNLAVIEYWRWWVVHLWVEGFFEVFATVVIAFLFTRMGLLGARTATAAMLFSTIIFLSGGIIGTFHHLYFTGTPSACTGSCDRQGGGAGAAAGGPAARPWPCPSAAVAGASWRLGRRSRAGARSWWSPAEPLPEVFDLATEIRQLPLVALGESQDRRLGIGRELVPNLSRQWRDRLHEGGLQRVPEPGKFGP